jgi:hypothetical protein
VRYILLPLDGMVTLTIMDRHKVFNDTYILELAVSSYYSQISHFSVIVNPGTS